MKTSSSGLLEYHDSTLKYAVKFSQIPPYRKAEVHCRKYIK